MSIWVDFDATLNIEGLSSILTYFLQVIKDEIILVEKIQKDIVDGKPYPPCGLEGELSGGNVSLSWTSGEDANGHRVFRRTLPDGEYAQVGDDIATPTVEFSDDTVETGNSYSYKVLAYNDNGVSQYTREIGIEIPAE